jgi:hypothetical protein
MIRPVLLEVWIEGRLAGRAPARLPLQQVDAMEVTGFAHQPPCAAILSVVAQARVERAGSAPDLHEARHPGLVCGAATGSVAECSAIDQLAESGDRQIARKFL